MPYKNYLEANKETEKRFYRICKELEMNGETLIENAGTPEWNAVLRKFGIQAKPLIDNEFIEPIWIQRKPGNHSTDKRLIRKKKDTIIKEIPGRKKSIFAFKRIEDIF